MKKTSTLVITCLFLFIALMSGCTKSDDTEKESTSSNTNSSVNSSNSGSDNSLMLSTMHFYLIGISHPDSWTDKDQETVVGTMRDSIDRYTGEDKEKYEEALKLIEKKNTTDVQKIYDELDIE